MNIENELIKKLRVIGERSPALWNSVAAYVNGANAALECGTFGPPSLAPLQKTVATDPQTFGNAKYNAQILRGMNDDT